MFRVEANTVNVDLPSQNLMKLKQKPTIILQYTGRYMREEENTELFLSLIQKNKGKENKQLRVGEREKMVMGRKL